MDTPLTREPAPGPQALQDTEAPYRLLVGSVRDYAILMLDASGRVLTWNAGAERFFGYPPEEIIGSVFSRFYPAETARLQPAQELAAAERDGAVESEGWRLRRDGSLFWANVVITAMRDPAGVLTGFAKITRDMTQRHSQDEALRRSEERFRLLVEGVSGYAIFMLDVNGRVATWNVGAHRIKGYTGDEIIGTHFSVFYPPDVRESGWPEHELQVAGDTGSFSDTGWRLRKDGTRFWAQVTITAMRDDGGHLVGFAKLTRDMTDSMRMEAMEQADRQREEVLGAERSARIAAQRATRMKDDFLATLSHELRTPLASILGWTQVLLRAAPGDPRVDLRRGVEVIDRNARAQVQLIDDLLDLSRIMAGKLRLDSQPVSLAEVVQGAVESLAPMAAAKGVALQLQLAPGRAIVTGDAGRLQQVVWNLLNNAIKFTPPGGHVQAVLQRVGGALAEFRVTDTGIGIAASFLPLVFDRFTQRDSSASRSHGGLGLGLAICKNLVELHGGQVRAESAGEGQGASFSFTLPLDADECEEAQIHPTAAPPDTAAPRVLPSLAGMHVFVLDDEPDTRDVVGRILQDQGAQVTEFACAAQMLAALQATRPTAILSDLGMPQMDGYQMIRALRATEPRESRIPALALSAFTRDEDRQRSLQAGFQGHLCKPFDMAELVLQVAALLGR